MMRAFFVLFLPISLLFSGEFEDFISASESLVDREDAISFLKDMDWQARDESKPSCNKCKPSKVEIADSLELSTSSENLYVLISFSVPLESWKDFSAELEKTQGVFVLKGLPGNSFSEFSERIMELKNLGVRAPVQINPEIYEKYEVESVPAIILERDSTFDKVIGNISLKISLEMFAEKGSTFQSAKKILQIMKDPISSLSREGEP